MASRASTVEYILEQMADAGTLSARTMFGEYAIYCDGRMVALVCDDQLFVKPTKAGRAFIGTVTEAPPYQVARPWFLICGDRWEDRDWLGQLVRVSAAELPLPVKKSGVAKKRAAPKRKG